MENSFFFLHTNIFFSESLLLHANINYYCIAANCGFAGVILKRYVTIRSVIAVFILEISCSTALKIRSKLDRARLAFAISPVISPRAKVGLLSRVWER